jgi:3-phenylpropionate/trans-cinnamate dioxygenase ferredoxin component
MNFQRVARLTDIPDPGRLVVEIDERLVVILHVSGEVFAIDDVCTHDGGPLGEGELDDHTIACPRHGAEFDIRTGAALTMPATRPTKAHDVKVEGGDVFVGINE